MYVHAMLVTALQHGRCTVCMINLWEEKLSAEEHIEIVPPGFDPLSTRVSGTYCTSRGEKQHYADGNRVGIR